MLQEFQKSLLVLSTGVKGLGIGKQNKAKTESYCGSAVFLFLLCLRAHCSIPSPMLPCQRLGLGAQLVNGGLTSKTSGGVSILSRPVDVESQWALRPWAMVEPLGWEGAWVPAWKNTC